MYFLFVVEYKLKIDLKYFYLGAILAKTCNFVMLLTKKGKPCISFDIL